MERGLVRNLVLGQRRCQICGWRPTRSHSSDLGAYVAAMGSRGSHSIPGRERQVPGEITSLWWCQLPHICHDTAVLSWEPELGVGEGSARKDRRNGRRERETMSENNQFFLFPSCFVPPLWGHTAFVYYPDETSFVFPRQLFFITASFHLCALKTPLESVSWELRVCHRISLTV